MLNNTVQAYDRYAERYDQAVIGFWRNFPVTTIEAFCSRLPGKQILDLGSGSGRDALLLREHGLEVTCLDASPSMVAMTQKLGFQSICAEFAVMKFHEGQFDGAWAYTSLIHVTPAEATAVLRNLRRFLKPEGVLAVGVIIGERAGKVVDNFMPGAERYIKDFQPVELSSMVTAAGFTLTAEEHYLPEELMQGIRPDGTPYEYQEDYLTQIFTKDRTSEHD